MSLRELYRTLELPGANRLRDAHAALGRAVGEAYAWGLPPALRELEPLALLLALNQRCAAAEREGRAIVGPGLPAFCDGDGRFFSDDSLWMPEPEGTPVEKGKSTAEMEDVGHTDPTGDDILDLEEQRELGRKTDREIFGDDY